MNINSFVKVLESADCKELGGFRCFIVRWDQFHELLDQIETIPQSSAMLLEKHGYENFDIKLSSVEEGTYYVCTKAEPILDALWAKKEQ